MWKIEQGKSGRDGQWDHWDVVCSTDLKNKDGSEQKRFFRSYNEEDANKLCDLLNSLSF